MKLPAHGAVTLADAVTDVLGADMPVALQFYDGSRAGPEDAVTTVEVRSRTALRRVLSSPGELGVVRAYVAGDIDVRGDIYAVLSLQERLDGMSFGVRTGRGLMRLARSSGVVWRPPAAPPEEARVHGRRHSRSRDAAVIAHHYDVSNDFYRLLLGPSMTYSCAVWKDPAGSLEAAQAAKYELICRKLALRPGRRLLDIGCGWGGMALHAARHHGVHAVGVTLSTEQAGYARRRVADAGLSHLVEIRQADYRELVAGPYDAISSIGMFEHVGTGHLADYFGRLHRLLAPGGRLLNHGISRPAGRRPGRSNGFIQRYVFPDGELQEVGQVASAVQHAGLEIRHLESLREHYALTLRAWVDNLERRYDDAVALVGPGRARIWRLYLAGSARAFESGRMEVYQTLAVRADAGASCLPLRPDWEGR